MAGGPCKAFSRRLLWLVVPRGWHRGDSRSSTAAATSRAIKAVIRDLFSLLWVSARLVCHLPLAVLGILFHPVLLDDFEEGVAVVFELVVGHECEGVELGFVCGEQLSLIGIKVLLSTIEKLRFAKSTHDLFQVRIGKNAP